MKAQNSLSSPCVRACCAAAGPRVPLGCTCAAPRAQHDTPASAAARRAATLDHRFMALDGSPAALSAVPLSSPVAFVDPQQPSSVVPAGHGLRCVHGRSRHGLRARRCPLALRRLAPALLRHRGDGRRRGGQRAGEPGSRRRQQAGGRGEHEGRSTQRCGRAERLAPRPVQACLRMSLPRRRCSRLAAAELLLTVQRESIESSVARGLHGESSACWRVRSEPSRACRAADPLCALVCALRPHCCCMQIYLQSVEADLFDAQSRLRRADYLQQIGARLAQSQSLLQTVTGRSAVTAALSSSSDEIALREDRAALEAIRQAALVSILAQVKADTNATHAAALQVEQELLGGKPAAVVPLGVEPSSSVTTSTAVVRVDAAALQTPAAILTLSSVASLCPLPTAAGAVGALKQCYELFSAARDRQQWLAEFMVSGQKQGRCASGLQVTVCRDSHARSVPHCCLPCLRLCSSTVLPLRCTCSRSRRTCSTHSPHSASPPHTCSR